MRNSLVTRISMAACLVLALGVAPAVIAGSHTAPTNKVLQSLETGWPTGGSNHLAGQPTA